MTAQVDNHINGTTATETGETAPTPRNLVTRETVLAADDRKYEFVEVPEWGGTVRIASMTGAQRLALDAASEKVDDPIGLALVFSIVDERGDLIFTPADLPKLREKNAAVMVGLLKRVNAMNALTKDGAGELKKN